jgi:NTE family protein
VSAPRGALPGFDLFRPGGLLSFSGYQPGELAGRAAAVARAGYWRAINPHIGQLRPNHYLGFWLEAGNAWPSRQQTTLRDLRFSGTVAVGARTLFGPLFLAYGRAEGGREAFYLTLGSAAGLMPRF